ncbi:methyl-accepting chemotaxis protein [Puniceicoccaceae bacterium K14]|nr:methyl-accepting chemotaxis protein [Puniceicoccaceae bacterium K14]
MNFKNRSLKFKIILFSLITSLVPLALLTWRVEVLFDEEVEELSSTYQSYAIALVDIIDRNLFERYGDVQAFAANNLARDRSNWGNPDEDTNPLVQTINKYVDLYDIYTAMILVDMEGRPIAVNTRNHSGELLNTNWIYNENYASASWFIDAKQKRFLKGEGTDGTVVEDVHVDPIIKQLDGGNGLGISYTAPVYDQFGEIVAVWSNRVSMDLVNQMCIATYDELVELGFNTAEVTLLNKVGEVIVDLDPRSNGGQVAVGKDMGVLLNLNLVEKGVAAAIRAVNGEHGGMDSYHARKEVVQTVGYAHSKGALGYKGLGWSALVRLDKAETMAKINSARVEIVVLFLISAVLVLVGATFMSKTIAKPVEGIAKRVLGNVESTKISSRVVDENAHKLAEGASEQAASVELTSSALEELSSMTSQNAQSVVDAKTRMDEAKGVVTDINTLVDGLKESMSGISNASEETQKIIKTIDEIAFQTNILALNAAVEAARAGEAGAGFAVVADEVRSLASRAAEAAQNTAGLIESNISKIDEGVKSVEQTDDGFKNLQSKTDEIALCVDQISVASEQQKIGLSQISDAIGKISAVTITNASTSEEAAAAAKEMSGQANEMGRLASELDEVIEGAAALNKPAHRPVASNSNRLTNTAPTSNVAVPAGGNDLDMWN